MIHVIATVELVAGKREDFLAEFHQLVPEVLREQGCIEYGAAVDLATDIASQSPLRENTVVIVEKWDDVAALKTHLVAPHMNAYRQRIKDFVRETKLQILAPTQPT